jgi:hypothetical protein
MRPLGEYGWYDWIRLRPVTHWRKTLRYNAERKAYVNRPARASDSSLIGRIRGRRVLVTIAFEDPEAIDMQAQLVDRFIANVIYVIADMSMDDDAAAQTATVAAHHNVPYVHLPTNPLRRNQASRIHGLALDWVWHNIIRPGEPDRFGFIDHDMFPTGPDDPFFMLDRQPIYGWIREVGPRWFLPAGFSIFRFDAVKELPLDFSQDWFNGLDTGGANWKVLFRTLDRSKLAFAPTHFEPYKPGADPIKAPFQWCGVWLHEVGSTRRDGLAELAADKRRVVKKLLASHLVVPAAQKVDTMTLSERSS